MKKSHRVGNIWELLAAFVCACLISADAFARPTHVGAEARAALERMDIRRGLCVVLGLGNAGQPGFVVDLAKGSELVMQP